MDAYTTGEQGIGLELPVNQRPKVEANLQLTDTNKVGRSKIFRLRNTDIANTKRGFQTDLQIQCAIEMHGATQLFREHACQRFAVETAIDCNTRQRHIGDDADQQHEECEQGEQDFAQQAGDGSESERDHEGKGTGMPHQQAVQTRE